MYGKIIYYACNILGSKMIQPRHDLDHIRRSLRFPFDDLFPLKFKAVHKFKLSIYIAFSFFEIKFFVIKQKDFYFLYGNKQGNKSLKQDIHNLIVYS